MNQFPGPAAPPINPKSKRNGCILGCSAAAGIFLLIPIVIGAMIYHSLFHTTKPVDYLAKIMPGSRSIEGVSGSVKDGFTIEKWTIKTSTGHRSELEGLTLTWRDLISSYRTKTIQIKEIGLERATIYLAKAEEKEDWADDDSDWDYEDGEEEWESMEEGEPITMGDWSFIMDSVDVQSLVFLKAHDPDFRFELDTLQLDSLSITDEGLCLDNFELVCNAVSVRHLRLKNLRMLKDEFEIESFLIDSDKVEIEMEEILDPRSGADKTYYFTGYVSKNAHEHIIRDFEFDFSLMNTAGEYGGIFLGFDEKVRIGRPDKEGDAPIVFNGFSPNDYFDTALIVAPRDINVRLSEDGPIETADGEVGVDGHFTIGTTEFRMTAKLSDDVEIDGNIVGQTQVAGTTIYCIDGDDSLLQQKPLRPIELTATPATSSLDIMSLLQYQQRYTDLDLEQQREAERLEGLFFSKDAIKNSNEESLGMLDQER